MKETTQKQRLELQGKEELREGANMIVIKVKYLGPTRTKGTRLKASTYNGQSLTLPRRYNLTFDQDAKRVAVELCAKMGWTVELCAKMGWTEDIIGGKLDSNNYVFVIQS